MIDPKTYPTLIAVCFFLAVLSLLLNFWNYKQINSLALGTLLVDEAVQNTTEESGEIKVLADRLHLLEKKTKDMEAKAAAAMKAEADAAEADGGEG
jgi:hypothetical protein